MYSRSEWKDQTVHDYEVIIDFYSNFCELPIQRAVQLLKHDTAEEIALNISIHWGAQVKLDNARKVKADNKLVLDHYKKYKGGML